MPELRTLRLIGRGVELQQLGNALGSFAEGAGEAPLLVTLGGEPGIGKSRLVAEVAAFTTLSSLRWVTARCAPHGPMHPWHPVRDLLCTLANLEPDLPKEARIARLEEFSRVEHFNSSGIDAARHLLSLPTQDPTWPDLNAGERQQRLFAGLRQLLLALGRERPTVVVFEDLHWIDPTTLEWLDSVLSNGLNGAAGSPANGRRPRLLILGIHRPEFRHLWPSRIRRLDLTLEPLSERESETLLRHIFGIEDPLPAGLRERIIRRTGGNPFFMEEAVRLLLDRGDLLRAPEGGLRLARPESEIDLPETPRGLVEERVHRLERRLRHLLQCAAIIGPEVRPQVLAHLAEVEECLTPPIEMLVDEQLLEWREAVQGLALLFRHMITHEVTYATILRRQREELHGRLGLYLEELHRDHLDEACELLAHHFGASDLPDKAVEYLRRAAKQASRLCAHEAADAHLRRLEEILTARDSPFPLGKGIGGLGPQRAWVALERGRLARLRGDFAPACSHFEAGVAALPADQDSPFPPSGGRGQGMGVDSEETAILRCQLLRTWAETERQRGRLGEAVALHGQALAVGESVAKRQRRRDVPAAISRELMLCRMALGIAQRAGGNPGEALDLLEQAEAAARRLGDLDAVASALNNRGICLLNLGQAKRALSLVERAVDLRRELGDRRNLVATLNNLGIVLERLLELDRALMVYGEALRMAYEIGHQRATLANHINVGQLLQWLDNQPEAMRHFRQVIEACGEQPDDVAQALALINLGWSHIHVGDLEAVGPLLEFGESIAEATGDHSATIHSLLLRAQWRISLRDAEGALAAAQRAAEVIEKAGGGDELATALRLRADAQRMLGDHAAARRSLREAAAVARRNDDRREEILILLSEAALIRETGRPAAHRRALARCARMLRRYPVPLLNRRFAAETQRDNGDKE
jgi:tetratricopeptide (TPR) repeat protein